MTPTSKVGPAITCREPYRGQEVAWDTRWACGRAGTGTQVSLTLYPKFSTSPRYSWHRHDRSQQPALKSEGFWAKGGVISLSLSIESEARARVLAISCSIRCLGLHYPFSLRLLLGFQLSHHRKHSSKQTARHRAELWLSQYLAFGWFSRTDVVFRIDAHQPWKARRKGVLMLILKRRK